MTRTISEGSRVRIDDGLPSLWRGQLQIDLDGNSSVSMASEGDSAPVVEVEAVECGWQGMVDRRIPKRRGC